MKATLAMAILFAALSISHATHADPARPLRFWVNTTDFSKKDATGHVLMQTFTWTAGATVPSSLVGWNCKLGEIRLVQNAAIPPSAGFAGAPASMSQAASLVCASVSGSVKATAFCSLQSDDEFAHEELDVTDAAGHEVMLNAGCRN
jgi:hypothetical protein